MAKAVPTADDPRETAIFAASRAWKYNTATGAPANSSKGWIVAHLTRLGLAACCAFSVFYSSGAWAQTGTTALKPKLGYAISRETTYFTGPLKVDGTIDFIAAVNAHFAQGVTPENNAARIIVPLLEPATWGTASNHRRDDVLRALGLDPAGSDPAICLVDFLEFAKTLKLNEDAFTRQFATAMERPWTDEKFPELAQWLAQNNRALDQIAQATRRPRFYVPLVASQSDLLIMVLLEHIQQTRLIARMFDARAKNHLANGRWNEAWDDILAIKRLGQLVGQGQTLIEGLVGIAITGMSCDSAVCLINEAESREVDWEALQESWEPGPVANVDEKIAIAERAMFVQIICQAADDPDNMVDIASVVSGNSEFAEALPSKLLIRTMRDMVVSGEVELNDILRYAGQVYDRTIAISRLPDAEERQAAFEELEAGFKQPGSGGQSPLLQVFFAKPVEPSRQFANVVLGLVFPASHAAYRAEWRTQASQNVVELALAARVVQARTGHLPGSLRELEPLVDEASFAQPNSGDPIAFRDEDYGALIYHWSADRKDNGGDIAGENPKDWGIRIRD
jgi:hypothetical protein